MTKARDIRDAMQVAANHHRRIDYFKRRLAYDVHRDMADHPESVRQQAIERGHNSLDLGLPRPKAYYYAYKGVLL